jgi:Lar family restriction alleviation protein
MNTEMMIKPCPFCGGKPMLLRTEQPPFGCTPRFFVTCAVCGVEMPRIARTRRVAVEVWNRRVNDERRTDN